MSFALPNRVQETTTTIGTGAVVLSGPVAHAASLASQVASGATLIYGIFDDTNYEYGYGTFVNTGGVYTLTRDTVIESSNANTLVPWSAGVRNVICGLPGSLMAALLDPAGFSVARPATFTGKVTTGANSANITVPSTETFAATQVIDLSKSNLKTLTVAANFTAAAGITTGTRVAGASAVIRMIGSGGPWTFPTSGAGWFADWVWLGARPTALASGKTGLLTLLCYGTAETDIVASWNYQT